MRHKKLVSVFTDGTIAMKDGKRKIGAV